MALNSVLNLFVGLVLTFASFSLLVTSATDAISRAVGLRARTLVAGIGALLNDPERKDLARAVLQHAAVNPLSDGTTRTQRPSNVDAEHFAAALVDVLRRRAAPDGATLGVPTAAEIRDAIARVPDPQLCMALTGMFNRAAGKVDAFESALADWFDAAMGEVTTWYKAHTQKITFGVALMLAGVLNIDAVHIAQVLWSDPKIVADVPLTNPHDYDRLFDAWAASFPIGWGAAFRDNLLHARISVLADDFAANWTNYVVRTLGWFLMAVSALFGAPFWFDCLKNLVTLRDGGAKKTS
jgi:hypothetical protein